jgi:UDP-N-acetylmuramoyl-L-alanyl-D-glutamate--2,6-diaminopimelate ligase
VNLLGNYNISNYLGALGVGVGLNFKMKDIIKSLSSFKTLKGRLESISNKKDIDIYIDFAHTPNSLENVLELLKKRKGGRLICVFGSAGERDREKRSIMGKISAKYADISIITAEDPRSEDVNTIISEIESGVQTLGTKEIKEGGSYDLSDNYYVKIPERGQAISIAVNKIAEKGDTVVICGKGHERSMAYNGEEYPWSDHDAVKEALSGKTSELKR